jgi:zinc transport system substrate-binding protein
MKKHRFNRYLFTFVFVLLSIFLLTGCSQPVDKSSRMQRLKVVTTLFPLYDFARQVGRERSEVILLLPPGVEPHSFEPKPGDVLKVQSADLFIYTGSEMEPWAERFVKSIGTDRLIVVDAGEGIIGEEKTHKILENGTSKGASGEQHYHDNVDPHVWLDFSNAQKLVDAIVDGFVRKDPDHRDYYIGNAQDYKQRLAKLDVEYQRTLVTCKKRIIIHGGHFAFNYLAKRYHLAYVSAYSGSPDAEPTARRLIELKNQVRRYDVHYIFYEELITPRVAEIIANETGARMLKLNGAHNVTREELDRGTTFTEIMEQNLQNLRIGLECQ